jgi:putative superfamily III holin-X
MLKPADPGPPPPAPERPIGELVSELIDEGKAYARAEIDLAKAIATAKAKALALPAALFGVAFILALAAVTALAVGVVIALETFIGPLAAGFVGMLIFAGLAGGIGWWGYQRLRQEL